MAIIEVENVSKRYRAARGVRALLGRGGLPDLVRGRRPDETTALEGVTFSVEPGESLGLIGANGSGKSTLLKIIAGVTVPSEGSVRVFGRVASLLELGAGFHPLLSGRENVYLNAGIHGMRHAQVDAIFDRIVEFSGIGSFIDYPVSTYSSGMYVRLGFAVASHLNPDIFLVDEVLAVGDEEFQRKCRAKIGELMDSGKTILFVSHDLSIVNVLCKRVVLLRNGQMIARGTPAKAIDFYLRQVGAPAGVHTLRSGKAEAIVSNGRISLFYDQQEMNSASGVRVQVLRLGAWRTSIDATWSMSDATDISCVARGYDAKLGLTYVWKFRFEGEELVWDAGIESERPLEDDMVSAIFHFLTDYTRWTYDEASAAFHQITPEEVSWTAQKAPELPCQTAGLLSDDESEHHSLLLSLNGGGPRALASWWNSDYLTKSRAFRIDDTVDCAAGAHSLFSVRINMGGGRDAVLERMRISNNRHTVTAGALQGRFERGSLSLAFNGEKITSSVHVYTSLLIQNLWNDSTNLQWDRLEHDGESVRVSGTSRRFPFKMHWTISPRSQGVLNVLIEIETSERLDVQEYQTSVLLVPAYTHWETPSESGDFPPIAPETNDWAHLNRNYAAGGFIRAAGDGLPNVEFNLGESSPLIPTPINTDSRQNARALQALAAPKHGVITFEPGKHVYFSGSIKVM